MHLEVGGWAVLQFRFAILLFRASFMFLRRRPNVRTGYTSTTRGQVAYATRQISKTKSNKRQNTVMLPPQFAHKRTGRRSQEFKPTPKYKHMTLFTLLPHIKHGGRTTFPWISPTPRKRCTTLGCPILFI